MNASGIDISLILNSSEFLGNALTAAQQSCHAPTPLQTQDNFVTGGLTAVENGRVEPKVPEDKKRERNILSSRKYRAKRRERMKLLEDTNKHLALQIKYVEQEVDEMKKKIHKFVRHAASCDDCGNLQIRFE